MGKVIYCHFYARRPKNKDYGMFAVACYADYEGKKLLSREVKAVKLWDESQHVTAIQSYEYALGYIFSVQGILKAGGVTNVVLVTNNTTLVNWIQRKGRNAYYSRWVEKAVSKYRIGGKKEIILSVGLCVYTLTDKVKKFCTPRFVENMEEYQNSLNKSDKSDKYEFDVGTEFKTAFDDLEDISPEIEGIIQEGM